MSSGAKMRRRVVLAGAGHAHLHTLKHAAEFSRLGVELVVIAPDDFWYSGLATGVLGGRYAPEEDQVDIRALVRRGGGAYPFIRDRVAAIDPRSSSLRLSSGATVSYDVLSLNLGSEVRPLPGAGPGVFAIKPLSELWSLRQELQAARRAGRNLRIVIAGGGASGCEIAANVRALLGADGVEITVLASGGRIVPAFSPVAARALGRWLERRGIKVHCDTTVVRIDGRVALTNRSERYEFDFLINATGLHPPEILLPSGLPLSERGELIVDEFLRSIGDARIFGGGDCVKLRRHELEKIGVYAVREAPVLFHNLLATLTGGPLRAFRPQRHCLLILNLGAGLGLARWRGFHWLGRAAFWLKDRLDRRFLMRYRRLV